MKIGIITFHRVLNYGAVLQGYALQTTLEKLGHEVEMIDYRAPAFEQEYRSTKPVSLTPRGVYDYLRSRRVKNKNDAFLKYVTSELHLSKACTTSEELTRIAQGYDVVITGSDQVFNLSLTHNDGAYFLDFLDSPDVCKASFAASIGVTELTDENCAAIKKYLQSFSYISVREVKAQKFLQQLGFPETKLHIDPSLILTTEEWNRYVQKNTEKSYVLIYSVRKEPALLSVAKELAEKYGLDIKYIKYMNEHISDVEVISDADPKEFVNLFGNASFVVTNLFHGTAFSIAMKRNFYVVYQKNAKANNRIEFLLESLNLLSRVCQEGEKIEQSTIDYSKVEEKLEQKREEAITYLRQVCEGKRNE